MAPQNYRDKLMSLLSSRLVDEHFTNPCILISGKWGVGKSYFIEQFTEHFEKSQSNKKIITISLFKINNVDNLQEEIACNIYSWIAPTKRFASSVEKISKIFPKLNLIPFRHIISFLDKIDFSDLIICFDDFERVSNKIDFTRLIGYISDLKERKNCKIIIVTNECYLETLEQEKSKDNSLPQAHQENKGDTWTKFSEKIIDYRYSFDPPIDENISTILKSKRFLHLSQYINEKDIAKLCTDKNTHNLRIIGRTLNNLCEFIPYLTNNSDENLKKEIIDCIFTESIDEYTNSNEQARTYSFRPTPNILNAIRTFIRDGHIDHKTFSSALQAYEKSSNIERQIYSITETYKDKISANKESTIAQLQAIIQKHQSKIPLHPLARLLGLLSILAPLTINKYKYIFSRKVYDTLHENSTTDTLFGPKYWPAAAWHPPLANIENHIVENFNKKNASRIIENDHYMKEMFSQRAFHQKNIELFSHINPTKWEYFIDNDIVNIPEITAILRVADAKTNETIRDLLNQRCPEDELRLKFRLNGMDLDDLSPEE